MRMAHLALLFVCLSFPMYMLGYSSPLLNLYNEQGGQPITLQFILSNIAAKMFDPTFLATVIGFAVIATILSGFSAVYMIPLALFAIIFNYVIVPSSTLWTGSCSPQIVGATALCVPVPIQIAVQLILNLIMLLTFTEYVRGGG